MLRLLLIPAYFLLALPAFAATPVTGAQLEQLLNTDRDKADLQLAAQISHLALTERLSAARLARCQATVAGPHAQLALTALADVAEFLDPPVAEIPTLPKPALESQRKMMESTVAYVATTMKQLPNLFATRTTRSFQDQPQVEKDLNFTNYGPFHPTGNYTADVLYRQGEGETNADASADSPLSLTTRGEFGSILVTILLDAARGNLSWSRWEDGGSGPLAVFRFTIAADKSHYEISFCCSWNSAGVRSDFRRIAGYQGELAIDPATGAVFRVSLRSVGLKRPDPILSASILVEYARRELGEKTYICPVKGIALSLAAQSVTMAQSHALSATGSSRPMQITLNDVSFVRYHLFTSKGRLLPESGNSSTVNDH